MRLYRGLKDKYQPERRPEGLDGVDFTDCPYVALLYASGRRGQVLVLDVPDDQPSVRVGEELWLRAGPRRLMIWGSSTTSSWLLSRPNNFARLFEPRAYDQCRRHISQMF